MWQIALLRMSKSLGMSHGVFLPIAGDRGSVSEPLLPKRGGQILCKKKSPVFIPCLLGILPREVGRGGLRNPQGSWEKLHIYLFSTHPKTIEPPTTGLATGLCASHHHFLFPRIIC